MMAIMRGPEKLEEAFPGWVRHFQTWNLKSLNNRQLAILGLGFRIVCIVVMKRIKETHVPYYSSGLLVIAIL